MILPLLLATLIFTAVLPIVLPMLRAVRAEPDRRQFDKAVYRDQLAEVGRDLARGVLTEAEATGARLEIQRRLLAADASPSRQQRLNRSPVLAACVALFAALGSLGVYLVLGAPMLPDMPLRLTPPRKRGPPAPTTIGGCARQRRPWR